MLLHESRREARTSTGGELIRLDDQDRSRWNRALIAEGTRLIEQALLSRRFGPYTVQAAISAVHAEAATPAATDWNEIVGLYDVLLRTDPSPIVELNRAVAVAMRDGPDIGVKLIDEILARGDLLDYRLAHAARADLCRRLGRLQDARASYERAIALTKQDPERRFLENQLRELRATNLRAPERTGSTSEEANERKRVSLANGAGRKGPPRVPAAAKAPARSRRSASREGGSE